MPTPSRFVIELSHAGTRLHLVAYTFAGVMANEVIGRVVAARIRHTSGRGAEVTSSDAGVAITVPMARGTELPGEETLRELFDPRDLARDLDETLEGSAFARAHFRDVARIAQLTVGSHRPGAATPGLLYDVLRKHAPDHVLLRALEQTVWSALDGTRAARTLNLIRARHWHVAHVQGPTALSIPLFARGQRDRLAPDDIAGALVAAAHALYLRHGAGELP